MRRMEGTDAMLSPRVTRCETKGEAVESDRHNEGRLALQIMKASSIAQDGHIRSLLAIFDLLNSHSSITRMSVVKASQNT